MGIHFIVIGSTLFALLPGLEFAPLIAAKSGGDVQAAQAALEPWFRPTLVTGAVLFALGIYWQFSEGGCPQRRPRPTVDLAGDRGARRDGGRSLRSSGCRPVLRPGRGRHRGAVANGIPDMESPRGTT